MDISSILRGLLDIVERGQSDESQATDVILPFVDTQEVSVDAAQTEFDSENEPECCCGGSDDYDELDVVKRNAGLPTIIVTGDESI